MAPSLRTLRAAVAVLVLVATAPAAAQAPKVDYRGTGVIVAILPAPSSLHATRPVIILEHDPIPPLMDEHMTMPFIAASAELFRGFARSEERRVGKECRL